MNVARRNYSRTPSVAPSGQTDPPIELLADENVPEEYVFALRGDGHEVVYRRTVPGLGVEATDDVIVSYAESEAYAVLTTDVTDFLGLEAGVPVLVAPQNLTDGQVRSTMTRLEALPFDPGETEPIWLSTV